MQHRLLLAVAIAVAGCQSPDPVAIASTAPVASADLSAGQHHSPAYHPSGTLPAAELARVRRATARYQDIQNAIDDQYVDIGVVIKNMGRHLLKDGLMDATFDAERPELLVYSPGPNGRLKLVAVEYAVPLALSENAPEGFSGSADEWFADPNFHLWTLHAWVWKENPDGIFNPTNRRVP